MKYHSWNNDKNEKLKEERNVSFEDVIYYIEHGKLLAILKHRNQKKYSGQKIYVLEINSYTYLKKTWNLFNERHLKKAFHIRL